MADEGSCPDDYDVQLSVCMPFHPFFICFSENSYFVGKGKAKKVRGKGLLTFFTAAFKLLASQKSGEAWPPYPPRWRGPCIG